MNHRTLLIVIGSLLFAWLAWWTYERNAAAPVRGLRAEIAETRDDLADAAEAIRKARDADRELRRVAERAIGDTPERAVHALRVALNTIAHDAQMTEISVDSRDAGSVRSPAERSRSFREADAREAPDFHIIEGSIRGTTSLENALAVLARVQSQPWPKQVVSASLTPRDEGAAVELNIGLRMAFLPGLRSGEMTVAPAEPDLLAGAERVARAAIFTPWQPPAVAVAPPEPPAAPAPAPRKPAWDQWSITGLVDGRDGQELLLVNRKSGERRALRPGQELLGLVFEGLRGETALIRAEEGVFALIPGQNLAQRDKPISDL